MKKKPAFPTSVELFTLVRKVADATFPDEKLSDAALGRMVGLESARTSRWKHGQIAVDDAARLVALSQTISIDIAVLNHVAAGYLSASEAWNLHTNEREFLRFMSEQIMLPQNEQALTLIDSEGSEARVVRNSATQHSRKFRRASSGRPISKKEQERVILLADDDAATIEIFTNITGKGTGVEGVVARTLSDALLLCGVHLPHMVIMDLFLLGADGFGALRALSANRHLTSKIIATSSMMSPDLVRRAKGCGAAQVLERPLRARPLGKLIRELRTG